MKRLVIVLMTFAVVGCGQRDNEGSNPIRVPLSTASPASSQASIPPDGSVPMSWTYTQSARAAWYGPPGAPALLAISCEGWEKRAARLVIVRYAPADKGAEALFAIQGSKGILRLPVTAVNTGTLGYAWRGVLDAADPRAEVLLSTGVKATVPGGGELLLAPMGEAGAVVSGCVSAATPVRAKLTAQGQTLPNLASNPDTSPADR